MREALIDATMLLICVHLRPIFMFTLSKRRFVQLAGLTIANRILPNWLWARPFSPPGDSGRKVIIVTFGGRVFNVQPLGPLYWLGIIAGTASVLVFAEVARRLRLAAVGRLRPGTLAPGENKG